MIACLAELGLMTAPREHLLGLTGTHLHLVLCGVLRVQVSHDAIDAERPSEAQQVGHVAEGAAEQDGTAKGPIHGAPD